MVAESRLGWIRRARLLPLLGLVMALTVLLAGCGANAASDPLLAAKVNGHAITLAQYQQMLALYRATNARNNFFTDWRTAGQRPDLASTQRQVLDLLVTTELLREQLSKQHLTVSAKAIQTARDTLKSQIAESRKQLEQSPDPALKSLLDSITPDVLDLLSQQEAMQALMQQKGKIPAVHLRGIEAKNQQDARDLQQKAESGSDFATLARQNSQNKATGDIGGDLGTFFAGQVNGDFDKAVFAPGAHPGKYLVLLYQGNYWLLELTDLGQHDLSTISDAQTQANAVTSWLEQVVRPGASIEEYVTVG
jgi:parvulin-like peptidyl-prolyl isomerase